MISYLFSAILIGVGFMFYNGLGIALYSDSDGNNTATADYLGVLAGNHEINVEANPNFIFGDYLAGLQAIGGLIIGSLTGGVTFDALSAVPFFNSDVSIMLTFRAIFTFSSFCLGVNILTGREL